MRIHIGGFVLTVAMMASVILQQPEFVTGQPKVAAMFVLGDSLVDVGNNNFINSTARANYFPYGIDSNFSATGRFSNGKNFVDLLAELVGISSPPAFSDPTTKGDKILGGVNYASAAGGILDESGENIGERFAFSDQLVNLIETMSQLKPMMSPQNFTEYWAKSLVVIVIGSNDYINNYLMPDLYASSNKFNPPEFAKFILSQYAPQLMTMSTLGLRRIFIAGIGPLGCVPNQRANDPQGKCVDSVNQMVAIFNQSLKSLVDRLNQWSTGTIYVYGNTYNVISDILNNPAKNGLTVLDKSCCEVVKNKGQITCMESQYPCANRTQYVYWDALNPTEAVNSILAKRAFSGTIDDVYPINVHQLTLLR